MRSSAWTSLTTSSTWCREPDVGAERCARSPCPVSEGVRTWWPCASRRGRTRRQARPVVPGAVDEDEGAAGHGADARQADGYLEVPVGVARWLRGRSRRLPRRLPDPADARGHRGTWAVVVLYALAEGPVRHGELVARVGGVSRKVLTQTLRRLQDSGLVERHEYAEFPPRVDYALTDLGRTLEEPIAMLTRWAGTYGADVVASQEASAAARPVVGKGEEPTATSDDAGG